MHRRPHLFAALITTLLVSCGSPSIWNAGDLARWVKDQAAAQGCDRSTIQLEDWYRSEDGHNVWHGTCADPETGARRGFAIPVDSVWKPSPGG
ncbi:MAG: hypothetical protein H7A50_16075 [Akkermansiaceae bacterium]|nr:hypothetical protein [Akkermansiaceae bacterium]